MAPMSGCAGEFFFAFLKALEENFEWNIIRRKIAQILSFNLISSLSRLPFPEPIYRGYKLAAPVILTISWLLEGILMEHKDMKNSLDSKLQIFLMCAIRVPFRS